MANSNKKATTIVSNKVFDNVFSTITCEKTTLNATLRNIAALAKVDKDVAIIAKWLNISESRIAKDRESLRSEIIDAYVFYSVDDNNKVEPCNLFKVAEIDGKNYYVCKVISAQSGIKMICARKNKGLETKHVLRNVGVIYDVDGNEVADANVLSKIAQMQQAKDEAKEVKASRRKAVDTKDVDALRMMIATFEAEKAAEAMKNA